MLRAIKYSAKTDAKMPFTLRKKIRSNADLLAQVSPSRLTEELLKIINSGHAQQIVSEALETDLYMSLQPAATAMMYADSKFEKNYMQNMHKLDSLIIIEPDARLGKKLTYLIKDFIFSLTDWKKEIETHSASGELYTKTWKECRSFVLPMNPQRTELEYAIKKVLSKYGLAFVKKKKPKKKQENS